MTSLSKEVGLLVGDTTMNVYVNEKNECALILARTFPPQFTPHSKYYVTKTIWFREDIVERGINFMIIDTVEQLGELFMKGLSI